jgi:hypothetical protein
LVTYVVLVVGPDILSSFLMLEVFIVLAERVENVVKLIYFLKNYASY